MPAAAQDAGEGAGTTNQEGTEDSADQATVDPTLAKLKANQAELSAKEAELSAIKAKIEELSKQHQTATSQAELAVDQLAQITRQVQTAQLQLDQTILNISLNKKSTNQVANGINQTHEQLADTREQLRDTIRSLYQQERTPLLSILLSSESLSTVLMDQRIHRELQKRAYQLIQQLHQEQDRLEQYQAELIKKQQDLTSMKELQTHQQVDLQDQQSNKNSFLKLKQEQQANYTHQLTEAKQARDDIANQIFSLNNLDLELTLTDAFSAARYASSLTGVRPSLLLAILKVETNVGEWVGSGSYPADMHPASRDAFLRLTAKLGLDPMTAPISRRPASYQGWGGAMGPGQFMPDTWERIEARVALLIGKPLPNPYELADAIVGTGIMLADRGAADTAKEFEAINRYLAGPNWQYHTWYGQRVLAVAKEYNKEGLE